VTVEIAAAPAPLELAFPAWLPGAYELRFFGRDVTALAASDEHGRSLRVRRDGASRVTVDGHVAGTRVVLHYRVGAELLSDDGADVGPDHAYLNPGAIVPRVIGLDARPHELVLEGMPPAWRAHSAAGSGARLEAASYLELIDQPVEAAAPDTLVSVETTAVGARFTIAIHADPAVRERAHRLLPTIARDLGRIAEAERALAGPLPFSRYLLVVHLSERATRMAGLEHAASASVIATPRLLSTDEYGELMHVLSHELFHTWNARRLVPAELLRPELEQVQPSAALWITEGLTEHAALAALGRAGLLSRTELGAALDEALTRSRTAERAGLSLATLARMAFSAPTALAADPDAYYAIGHVVALALVAGLLDRSAGKIGLEELLAAILPPAGAPPRAIDTAVLGRAADVLAPPGAGERPLSALLEEWVEQPFTLAALLPTLARGGVVTETQRRERLDLAAIADGDPPTLRVLEPGGAFARAGAQRGDQLLRIDGQPAHAGAIVQLLRASAGAPVRVELARGSETLALRLEPRRTEDFAVRLAPQVLGPHERTLASRLARLLGALPRR
jgi:predicted metalloprotease with PDZ domain